MRSLSNITLKEFRAILTVLGLHLVRVKGGYEMWVREGMTRPIVIQTHIDPIPEFVVRSNIKSLGVDKREVIEILENM